VLALALALALAAAPARPVVAVHPLRARPGDAFLVVVRGAAERPRASVAGRDLAFFEEPGRWVAVAGLPVETPGGPMAISALVPAGDGRPREALASLDIVAPEFPHRELEVQRQFVEPPAPALERRIEEDRAAFARAFAQPSAPPLFRRAFALPRRARITAHFGEERSLNAGAKRTQHYGTDLAGRVGDPVAAANDGAVVLVRDCWASGLTVVLWHGAGVYSTYFHLSRAAVKEGARVRRGQRLGAVGKSGRVTGPHLHWGVRVGDLYVDPESVLRLPLASVLR
jgi:murein DD-endopeptidase MepM/ murein hydrolase activator NlpD